MDTPRIERKFVRLGDTTTQVLAALAVLSPARPADIIAASKKPERGVFKAIRLLLDLGWLELIALEADGVGTVVGGQRSRPLRYQLTRRGWREAERHLLPLGLWTVGMADCRYAAVDLTTTS